MSQMNEKLQKYEKEMSLFREAEEIKEPHIPVGSIFVYSFPKNWSNGGRQKEQNILIHSTDFGDVVMTSDGKIDGGYMTDRFTEVLGSIFDTPPYTGDFSPENITKAKNEIETRETKSKVRKQEAEKTALKYIEELKPALKILQKNQDNEQVVSIDRQTVEKYPVFARLFQAYRKIDEDYAVLYDILTNQNIVNSIEGEDSNTMYVELV